MMRYRTGKAHWALAALVVAVLLLATVAYKVEFTEYALVTTFGAVTDVDDGKEDAGLHFKWPWPVQKLIRYDARTHVFEDTASEVPTRDKQNLLLTMYCAWRIADPQQFYGSLTPATPEAARQRLRDLLRNAKKTVVGQYNMEAFVNTDPEAMRIQQIEQEVLVPVAAEAAERYGIEVLSVGVKSLALPENVSAAVIEAMTAERQRDVRKFQSRGEAQATAIRVRAQTASRQILAFAETKAAEIRSEGVRAAAQVYKSFRRNERLSMFLRYLESLETELSSRSVILLDASVIPALEWFGAGPSLPEPPALPASPVDEQTGGQPATQGADAE